MKMTWQQLVDAAAIEDALAAYFTNQLPAGTLVEGSPHWETLRRGNDAAARGAALRDLAYQQHRQYDQIASEAVDRARKAAARLAKMGRR